MNILLNMSDKKANSKVFKSFKLPIAPQIDSDKDVESLLIKSKTFINPDHSLTTVFKIF
jgi:hypothetical protein